MIEKGFNICKISPRLLEKIVIASREPNCCEFCISPFRAFGICKPLCKYRKATYAEYLENSLKEGVKIGKG